MKLSKKVRSNVRHKILMKELSLAKQEIPKGEILSEEQVKELRNDAEIMTDLIAEEYLSKKGAGAMWLSKKLNDMDWLTNKEEDVYLIQLKKKFKKGVVK